MGAPAEFSLDTSDPRFAIAHLTGRLDTAGTGAVELPFTEASAASSNLAVDLSGVDYVSSVGLRLIMLAARATGRRGGRLVVVNPQPNVAQVLRAAGLQRLVSIVAGGDVAAAFADPLTSGAS